MIENPSLLFTIAAFLAVLGPLVFVHELGHYWAARALGVRSEAFSIGFGPRLFGWRDRHGTDWRVSAIPLGGYVRFKGDRAAPVGRDAMTMRQRGDSFPAQPVWSRALIVLAGPAINLVLAIAILAGFAVVRGQAVTPPVVAGVMTGSAAERAGVVAGDRFVSIDGRAIDTFTDVQMAVAHRAGERFDAVIARDGAERRVVLTPTTLEEVDRFGNRYRRGLLGVAPGDMRVEPVGILEAPGVAARQTVGIVRQMAAVIGQFVTGRRPLSEMGGPVKIAKTSGEFASMGGAAFIFFIALISINLAFINLLPVPTLDGGHLLFYAYEALARRPADARVQAIAFRAGLAAMAMLMLVVTFHDLSAIGLWDGIARLIG